MNAHRTNKERHIALLEVVQFAKDHGFPDAEIAYWDPDNSEEGNTDVEEVLIDHDPGTHRIDVGIYLHKGINYTVHPSPDEGMDDAFERVSVAGGDAL